MTSEPNAVESLHRSLRKIIKTRGSFPTDEAALKLLLSLERVEFGQRTLSRLPRLRPVDAPTRPADVIGWGRPVA